MGIDHSSGVPHLTTVLAGPLLKLERHLLERQASIESWLRAQWLETPAPFYASVDLRNAGFKLAPVDTNLFSAGFNNLNPAFMPLCIQAVQSAVERICPRASKLLLIPESHTRNVFYLESLATLHEILSKAGFEVRLGSLIEDLASPLDVALPSGRTVHLEPLLRKGDRVGVANFFPCMVLLNNDLSSGRPAILEGLEQPVVPPLDLGWSNRLKSDHFRHYRQVAQECAELIDIDPWLIDPLFRQCGEINFMKREGEECLATNVDALLKSIQRKYDEYDLDKKPFVIVKADAGTYGMGIMTIHSTDEIYELNRKQRTHMAATKGGQSVTQVIIQEGVYTFETWGDAQAVAEPVVYMIDRFVVGGFYRVHTARGVDENLNAPGMQFEPLAFAEPCNNPDPHKSPDANPNRFYAYGVIARFALLAAAREIAGVRA
ncbi:MAG: glutamate--cysteine ligase [Gammaproteobacteria bacterium]|nr:glutamate--cysteine ligase [Gammaproteobacteria bacterium]